MEKYTYTIKSVDATTHVMVVEYAPDDNTLETIAYNIHIPETNDNIAAYVDQWAPQNVWAKQRNPRPDIHELVGVTGTVDAAAGLNHDVVDNVDEFSAAMAALQDEFEKENA